MTSPSVLVHAYFGLTVSYLRFGVREHAMSSVCNGLAAYGGLIPFAATFLTFVGLSLSL